MPEARWLADQDFREAKEKVEGHLDGIINSSLSSAGWLPRFKHVIDTRPKLTMSALTENPPCDACAQGKTRRATFLGTFSASLAVPGQESPVPVSDDTVFDQGEKYDRKTLQPLNPSEDESEPPSSSSSSSSDDTDTDAQERQLDLFGKKMTSAKRRNRKRKSKDKEYEYNRESPASPL